MGPGTARLSWKSLDSKTLRGRIHWVKASSESFSFREARHEVQGCEEVIVLIIGPLGRWGTFSFKSRNDKNLVQVESFAVQILEKAEEGIWLVADPSGP